MAVDPEFRRRLENLARGLLPDAEADELRKQVAADPELARLLAEPKATPRPVTVPFVSKAPGEAARARSVRRTDGSARITWARWANWVVGISAGVFLLISLGGYLYHRGQL